MLWALVWVTIVLGGLGTIAFLAFRLWRQAKALLAQLEASGEVLGRLTEAIEALDRTPAHLPAELVLSDERRADLHQARAEVSAARTLRRQDRAARAGAQWAEITG